MLPVLAVGYAVATVAILPEADDPITTYATGPGAATILVAAGLGLVAAGTAAWWDRPTNPAGPLAVVAGVAWLAPVWVGWTGGPALARSLGAVATPFLLPALAHLLLAYPSGRLPGRTARLAASAGWLAAGVFSLGRALFRNPLHDLRCWSNCHDNNVFLLTSNQSLARALDHGWTWLGLGFGALLAGWAAWRLAAATPARRAMIWPVLVPAGVAMAGEAVYAGGLGYHAEALRTEPAEPTYPVLMAIFLARGVALVVVALGLGFAVLRERRRRAALARLADELGATPPPGSVQAALAASLGDPTLRVGYWQPSARRWVDAAGRPLPESAPGQATTAIHRGGEPVAVVRHDPELAVQIGSAARLAIDNERLRAEALAQLEEVRASRNRIVATADAERRRLERDLHDGAQQRLLAVSYELRLARAEADAELARVLDRAADEVRAALAELRDLAHGIFPAVLDEAGLGPALWTLADTATGPVELDGVPADRLPPDVERAAYLVVAGTVEKGSEVGLRVSFARQPGRLVVEVSGAADDQYLHLADRIGALGGRLVTQAECLRAEIPCG